MTHSTSLDALLEKRLYHELTSALLNVLSVTDTQSDRVNLFRKYVGGSLAHFNHLRVVELLRQLLRKSEDEGTVVTCLIDELFSNGLLPEANFQAHCLRTECELRNSGASETVRETLLKLEDTVHACREWRSNAEYHRVSLLYSKVIGNLGNFYMHAVRYIQVTPVDEMHGVNWVASEAALAGLLSPEIFDLGGLLIEEKKLGELLGEQFDRVMGLLHAFDSGDVRRVEEGLKIYTLSKDQLAVIREKTQVMGLLEICSKSKFVQIDQEMEQLILRAFGGGLLRGSIDQVAINGTAQTLVVEWVRPRILDKNRISKLAEEVRRWSSNLEDIAF